MLAIAGLGIGVAIDDFGVGYASISRLHQLPISELKIDKSFVSSADRTTRSYLAAIVRFGHGLGLRIIAEGVEDVATVDLLAGLGCDLVQGFHVSKPLSASAMDTWLFEASLTTHIPALAPGAPLTPLTAEPRHG